jgi:hypothetical protein
MMEEKQFKEIVDRLDKIIKLVAVPAVQGKNIEQSIIFLDVLGFRPIEIAAILGRTTNQINVTLSNYRKKMNEKGEKEGVDQN